MKPYGLPRHHDNDNHKQYGRKSSLWRLPSPDGKTRSILSPAQRAHARRLLARAARRVNKNLCLDL